MTSAEFSRFRKELKKTQKQMGELLGTSIKAIHSYEQGWRTIPPHVERQMFFLISKKRSDGKKKKPCWVLSNCPAETKSSCPAWEFKAGDLCWFINGTICHGEPKANWKEKIKVCRTCAVFTNLIG